MARVAAWFNAMWVRSKRLPSLKAALRKRRRALAGGQSPEQQLELMQQITVRMGGTVVDG